MRPSTDPARHAPSRNPTTLRPAPALPPADTSPHPLDGAPSSAAFAALQAALRATGGVARADDIARLLEDHHLGNYIGLARMLAAGEVFGFEWRGALWIPMFQFDLRDLSTRSPVRPILAALGPDFDGWGRATWFARPNAWLNGRSPLALLDSDLAQVLDAARTDRFVAAG